MKLYHTTPIHNLPSIKKKGLLPDRATTLRNQVWLHHERLIDWAFVHVARRHHFTPVEMALLSVFVPDDWLERRASGLWTVVKVIEPDRIRGLPTCHREFLRTLQAIRALPQPGPRVGPDFWKL